jgi:thiol-disulfide isomerase/thioredoxin
VPFPNRKRTALNGLWRDLKLFFSYKAVGYLKCSEQYSRNSSSTFLISTPFSFIGTQLYVLEFWATWCGHSKMAMPHITKLQQQFRDKISFIGVRIWKKVAESLMNPRFLRVKNL